MHITHQGVNMMETKDKLGIKLEIGNQHVAVNIPRENEEIYRRAGKFINQRINVYATMYPQKNQEQLMAMALLDIAMMYLMNESKNDVGPYAEILSQLTSEIEEIL